MGKWVEVLGEEAWERKRKFLLAQVQFSEEERGKRDFECWRQQILTPETVLNPTRMKLLRMINNQSGTIFSTPVRPSMKNRVSG